MSDSSFLQTVIYPHNKKKCLRKSVGTKKSRPGRFLWYDQIHVIFGTAVPVPTIGRFPDLWVMRLAARTGLPSRLKASDCAVHIVRDSPITVTGSYGIHTCFSFDLSYIIRSQAAKSCHDKLSIWRAPIITLFGTL